ncbi:MAG: TIR domain-containing protein [Phycisphaerales bacterium]
MHDVFLSHASVDKPTADAACHALEAAGVRVWMAPRDVVPGTPYGRAIIEAIKDSRLMVVVFSQEANASEHVAREVELAARERKPLLPMRVAAFEPSDELMYFMGRAHWLDALAPPVEAHLGKLVAAVLSVLGTTHIAPAIQAPPARPPESSRTGTAVAPKPDMTRGVSLSVMLGRWGLTLRLGVVMAVIAAIALPLYLTQRGTTRPPLLVDSTAPAKGSDPQPPLVIAGSGDRDVDLPLTASERDKAIAALRAAIGTEDAATIDAAIKAAEKEAPGDERLTDLKTAATAVTSKLAAAAAEAQRERERRETEARQAEEARKAEAARKAAAALAPPPLAADQRVIIEAKVRKSLQLADIATVGPAEYERVALLFLSGTKLNDQALAWLAHPSTGLKSLTQLHLWGTQVTNAGVKDLSRADTGLKSLTHLDVSSTQVTDAGVKELARADTGLKSLTRLVLSGAQVTDTGLKELARADTALKSLTELGLSNTQVTDAGLKDMARADSGLKTLTHLDLSSTQVTDAGVTELARPDTGLKSLTSLNIWGTKVTDAGVAAVKARFPGIKVER